MWSGCAGSRSFLPSGVASQQSFGVYQGGHRPRWSYPTDHYQTTRRDHRGWSTHTAASRDKPAKPNQAHTGICATSGEIGTNAMHPPGKRSIDINKSHFHADTHGRTRRSAPTRSLCRKPHIQDETDGQRAARWNVERVGREPDISADDGCKPAHNRRLSGRAPSPMVINNIPSRSNPS